MRYPKDKKVVFVWLEPGTYKLFSVVADCAGKTASAVFNYKTDDMVICAHNYARFFAPIRGIGMGEEVCFFSAEGTVYRYSVTNRETLEPSMVEEMITNTRPSSDGTEVRDWDLTLFTCFPGGRTRCAVRCIRISEEENRDA